jgi:hypothetical protein
VRVFRGGAGGHSVPGVTLHLIVLAVVASTALAVYLFRRR